MGQANVWEPRTVLQTSANTKELIQDYTAVGAETEFTITDFAYILGTGGLVIFKNGVRLIKGIEWKESTETSFTLLSVSVIAGDVISAVAFVGIEFSVNNESFETFAQLQASTSTIVGQSLVCRERGNADYIIQPAGYVVLTGDAVLASGLVAALQSSENVRSYGIIGATDCSAVIQLATNSGRSNK
jgi:hypothetical protein